MSRSTRKPYITDQQSSSVAKQAKRLANRRVRKSTTVTNGKAYRKESDSWAIRDFYFYAPKNPKAHRK